MVKTTKTGGTRYGFNLSRSLSFITSINAKKQQTCDLYKASPTWWEGIRQKRPYSTYFQAHSFVSLGAGPRVNFLRFTRNIASLNLLLLSMQWLNGMSWQITKKLTIRQFFRHIVCLLFFNIMLFGPIYMYIYMYKNSTVSDIFCWYVIDILFISIYLN